MDRRRCRVAEPDAVVRHDMEATPGVRDAVGGEHGSSVLPNVLVVAEDLDTLVPSEHARDLAVDPRDGRELAGPVGLVVRPGKPRGVMRLPLRRKAEWVGNRELGTGN